MQRINVVSIKMVKEKTFNVESKKISSPEAAFNIVNEYLKDIDREHLIVLALNTKNEVNAINTVSIGSLNASIVHPREVFKALILANAAAFIVAHNHPSGNPQPSKEDVNITGRLKECGRLMGIELLDHIILGDDTYVSLKKIGSL